MWRSAYCYWVKMFKIIELVKCFKIYVMNTISIHVQVSVMSCLSKLAKFWLQFWSNTNRQPSGRFHLGIDKTWLWHCNDVVTTATIQWAESIDLLILCWRPREGSKEYVWVWRTNNDNDAHLWTWTLPWRLQLQSTSVLPATIEY